VAAQKLGLGPLPTRLGVEQQAVQVEDRGTKTPRKAEGRLGTSGAIGWGSGSHSGGSSR
jgi:hypothetical protein